MTNRVARNDVLDAAIEVFESGEYRVRVLVEWSRGTDGDMVYSMRPEFKRRDAAPHVHWKEPGKKGRHRPHHEVVAQSAEEIRDGLLWVLGLQPKR